jgi:hypothetical protein
MSEEESNPIRQQREHIRRLERQLRERDQQLAEQERMLASKVPVLEARLHRQRLEILVQDMGLPRDYADLYLTHDSERCRALHPTGPLSEGKAYPPDPDELDLADFVRDHSFLSEGITKPLPVRLHLGASIESRAGTPSQNGTRGSGEH